MTAPAQAPAADDTQDLDQPTGANRDKVRAINRAIVVEEQRLRARHGWLAHQDALGAAAFVGSLALMAALAAGFLAGVLPWWVPVLLMGVPISILHELEHDLIHNQYFKAAPRVQRLMFLTIWWAKLNVNPYYRKVLHLRHHRRSGQPDDAEERFIGLGEPAGLYRILIAAHPVFSGPMIKEMKKADPTFRAREGVRASRLQFLIFIVVLFFTPVLALLGWLAPGLVASIPPGVGVALNTAMILWVAPNLIRQTCLALISSYSHYYGDIPPNDVFCQNQILDHWALWPMQLYCFNFGSTHIIHHFVVGQPFYLRQMVAAAAHEEMLRQGVRRNDFGVVARANRWALNGQAA